MGLFDNFSAIAKTVAGGVVILTAMFIYLSYGNLGRAGKGLGASMGSILRWSTLELAMFFLIVAICTCQIINAKIRGYYDGIYAFNTSSNADTGITDDEYNNLKFPIPYGYKIAGVESELGTTILNQTTAAPLAGFTASTLYNIVTQAGIAETNRGTDDAATKAADAEVTTYLNTLWTEYQTAMGEQGMVFLTSKKAQELKDGFAGKLDPIDAQGAAIPAASDPATAADYKPVQAMNVWMIPIAEKKNGDPAWFNIGTNLTTGKWIPHKRDENLVSATPTYWDRIFYQQIGIESTSGKPYVSLVGLKNILSGISVLQWSCILILFAVILFNNFPLEYSRYPGRYGPGRTVKMFVMLLGLLMTFLTSAVFMTSLASLAEFNGLANLGGKHKVSVVIGQKDGQDVKQDYYFPTKIQQIYPPMNQMSGWFYILIFAMCIASGLAFATIKSDIPGNAYNIMKIKSGLVSELHQTGSLIAYEMRDPLFKLLDSAIAKKASRKQVAPVVEEIFEDGKVKTIIRTPKAERTSADKDNLAIANVIPRLSDSTPIKLFDFVTVDGLEWNAGAPVVWLVAAADAFTYIKDTRKNENFYSTSRGVPETDRWTNSAQGTMSPEGVRIGSSGTSSIRAKMAIFGNSDYQYEPDSVDGIGRNKLREDDDEKEDVEDDNNGSISMNVPVTLIPMDPNIIDKMIVQSKMTEEEFDEIQKYVRRRLVNADDTAANHPKHKTLYNMIKEIIKYEFKSPRGLRDKSESTLDLQLWNPATGWIEDTYLGQVDRLLVDEIPEGRAAFGEAVPYPRLVVKTVGPNSGVRLYRRVVENHNMLSVTALDLIHLRYSLVKDLLFRQVAKYSGADANTVRKLYENREKHFPTNNPNLLRTLLPALKRYVEPETLQEYNYEVHRLWPAGHDENKVIDRDINTFARRFNEMMDIQTTPYLVNNTPKYPLPPPQLRDADRVPIDPEYSINESTNLNKRKWNARVGVVPSAVQSQVRRNAQHRALGGPRLTQQERNVPAGTLFADLTPEETERLRAARIQAESDLLRDEEEEADE